MTFIFRLYSILKNPRTYPGKHNFPTERTNPSQPALEPKSQVSILFEKHLRLALSILQRSAEQNEIKQAQ